MYMSSGRLAANAHVSDGRVPGVRRQSLVCLGDKRREHSFFQEKILGIDDTVAESW